MKQLTIVAAFLLVAACAAVDVPPDVNARLEQIETSGDLRFSGPIYVKYRVWASNFTEEPITLDRVELHTIGPGAYTLNEPALPLKLTIPPKEGASAVVMARGTATGGTMSMNEPVNVRVTAYFTRGGKSFVRVFNQSF